MNFEVLLSCMHKSEYSIIDDSNLKNINTLIINQCNNDDDEKQIDENHRVINSKTRGLSISRNIGIENAREDICLFADDDELFIDGLENVVLKSYDKLEDANIIIFQVKHWPKILGDKVKKLSKFDLLRVSSVQISFRTSSIQGKVKFDPYLGAGTKNGSGEENKFLLDCYRQGMSIYYFPVEILELKESNSTWFTGFNRDYFYKRGYTTRYIYGFSFAFMYALYFIFTKRKLYSKYISTKSALYYILKGLKDNCIIKQKEIIE